MTRKEKGFIYPSLFFYVIIAGMDTKLCTECNNEYPVNSDHFYKDKRMADGFKNQCKECTRKQNNSWKNEKTASGSPRKDTPEYKEKRREDRQKNKKRDSQYNSQWRKDNPGYCNAKDAARRENVNISDLPPEEQERIRKIYKKAQEFKDQGLDVHVDHVIPVSKGGKTTPDNLVIISAEDNQFKSNKEISSRTATHMIVEGREIEILYPHY